MEQTARDIGLTLQRDYFAFSLKKTTELSTKVPIYNGYVVAPPNAYPNILWTAGSEVDSAFQTLWQLLTQLSKGSYQNPPGSGGQNLGVWPVQTINWQWIRSLYAYVNPTYAAWLVTNNITVPSWSTAP